MLQLLMGFLRIPIVQQFIQMCPLGWRFWNTSVFSSTQCQTLNNTVPATIQDFCTVAAVEIFIDCKKEHADSSTTHECLTSILGTLPSFSSLFSSCLCHGYIENYTGMWAFWNIIYDEDAPHTSFGDSSVGFYSINHEKTNVRVGRRVQHLPEEAFE